MCRPQYIKNYDFRKYCYNTDDDSLELFGEKVYTIPNNIHYLIIDGCDITNIKFPQNLKKLRIYNCYTYKKNIFYYICILFTIIKKKISFANIYTSYLRSKFINYKLNIDALPDSVEYLEITPSCYLKKYPLMLKKLLIDRDVPSVLNLNIDLPPVFNLNLNLPNSLTHLSLPSIKMNCLKLPHKLKCLNLVDFIGKIIYPESLKYLNVYSDTFNFSDIPTNIKSIGICSNNTSINNLPSHIKKIRLYVNDNNTDITNLPSLLAYIYIDYYGSSDQDINIKIPFGCKQKLLY